MSLKYVEEIFKELQNGESKERENEVSFLYFMQIVKMPTILNYKLVCIIFRAATKQAIQRDIANKNKYKTTTNNKNYNGKSK